MKALSLWQPWASAIALGAKRIETRSWATLYRGRLAIHAAKRCVKSELDEIQEDESWRAALNWPDHSSLPMWATLPFGCIVCLAQLTACRTVDRFLDIELYTKRWRDDPEDWWTESMMGNFEPGRWGWVLEDVRIIVPPVPWRGERGLFEVPDEILAAALAP